MLIELYDETIYYDRIPAYGNIPTHLKSISFGVENERKKGCMWRINGERCGKPCLPIIFYCNDHKEIPDIKRDIHEPITTCTKRKNQITNNTL